MAKEIILYNLADHVTEEEFKDYVSNEKGPLIESLPSVKKYTLVQITKSPTGEIPHKYIGIVDISSIEDFIQFFRQRPIHEKYLHSELQERHENIFAYAWLTDDIGYIHFNRFSDVEKSVAVIDEIIAFTLRSLGQGTKVACEITLMAADAGLIPAEKEIIAIGGTGHGADTAAVLLSANSQDLFELRILEILCKPRT